MPKQQKPKPDYQTRPLLDSADFRPYGDKDVKRLARRFKIVDPEKTDELKNRLQWAAQSYRFWRYYCDEAPRSGEMKAAIDEIEELAGPLLDRLEGLDRITANLFWLPEIEIADFPSQPEITETRFGHTVFRWQDDDGHRHTRHLERTDLFEALRIIKAYCEEAQRNIPVDPGGQKPDLPLRQWAFHLSRIWEEFFDQDFTVNAHKGEPTSEAAEFCIEACKIMDSKVPHSRVMGAMKKVIKAHRDQVARRNLPPK